MQFNIKILFQQRFRKHQNLSLHICQYMQGMILCELKQTGHIQNVTFKDCMTKINVSLIVHIKTLRQILLKRCKNIVINISVLNAL